ncbi:MAG: hypothetical protein KGN79_16255 [Acidobacteriota bacterium]|nr:hypothetical protein [Acidobacteriota bacterium]
MNEIAQMLQQKFGLSTEQAQEAENAVLGIIRSKVPAEFQGIFDSIVSGQNNAGNNQASGGLGGLLGAAEGLFGAK